MNRHLIFIQKVERAEGHVRALRSQGHDREVHAVELDVGIEHCEAGGGEMHGGKLDVVPVQGLLDHGLMELGGLLAARALVATLCLGGDRHEQRSRAAGEVGHVEGRGELVVLPVDMRRPVVEYETGKHRSGGHGGVVGPRKLGVGQQGVEEASRQVVPFDVTSLVYCP